MTLDEFRASVGQPAAPQSIRGALLALWHDARGDWEAAHAVAQEVEDSDGAWVHAYLHRKEGDLSNAAYWYRRAARPVASGPLPAEWEAIAAALLASDG